MKAFEGRAPVEYPRKRASIACNFCRHRKRKCDGQKPTCGLCADAGAQCEYQESDRVQDIPAEILLRLSHMETLLQQQKEAIAELSTRVTSQVSSPQADPLISLPNVSAHLAQPRYNWYPSPANTYHDRSSISLPPQQNQEEPLPIPLGHSTPTERLFFLDRIKNLIGEYPQDFFMQLESTRLPKFEDKSVNKSFDQIDPTLFQTRITEPYFNEFLTNVHAFFPLMEPLALRTVYENFTLVPRGNSIQTILCLVIIALGKVSSNPGHIFDIEAADDRNGIEYFAPAYHELKNRWSAFLPMNRSPFVPLAFVYASLYFRYIGRPFQASNMITDASTAVKSLHSLLSVKPMMREHDTLFRTTWACYILECDDLAEFNFPRSGIEFLVEGPPSVEGGMHFPRLSEPTQRSNLVFLAMCSIRKLLNRVHTWIYDPTFLDNYAAASPSQQKSHSATPRPQKHSIASLERICVELNRQLEEWFQSLPPQIRPDLKKPMSHQDAYDSYIRARYYATKHIIYRPSLVYAAQNKDNNVLPDYVFGNCKQCIASCRKFVEAASLLLEKRTHSNWLRMQALLAAIFTLATAKSTPSLEAIVSDFDFDQLMKEAIQSIGLWAQHSETADAILSIIKTIRQKIRLSVSRT